MRRTLVAALVSCAGKSARTGLRRFLSGLSADELEFLAGFHGARILERSDGPQAFAGLPAEYTSCLGRNPDRDHKVLLLGEYLSRLGAYGERANRRAGRSAPGLA